MMTARCDTCLNLSSLCAQFPCAGYIYNENYKKPKLPDLTITVKNGIITEVTGLLGPYTVTIKDYDQQGPDTKQDDKGEEYSEYTI